MEERQELVVLIDENDNPIGTEKKSKVHTENTPLHRGFSVFIFNKKNQLLLQQRSKNKKTWPLAWSNSCCGHPAPGESYNEAAKRRSRYELELDIHPVLILPRYKYRYQRNGIVENEICPVFVAKTDKKKIDSNPLEVEKTMWMDWNTFLANRSSKKYEFSEWCREEAEFLSMSNKFKTFMNSL